MTAYKLNTYGLTDIPEPNLRSKTKILHFDNYNGEVDILPDWSFDEVRQDKQRVIRLTVF